MVLFAVSLATSGFVLSANANERKTALITFTGVYVDSVAGYGYVRARDGIITTFDVAGAGTTTTEACFFLFRRQCDSIR